MPTTTPTVAELLTQQFYDWEIRGRGWTVYDAPVELEPPFRPFEGHQLNRFALDDGLVDTGLSRLGKGFKTLFGPLEEARPPALPPPEIEEPPPAFIEHLDERFELVVALPPQYEPNPNIFAQCLLGLAECRAPLAFEIVGTSEGIVTVISAARDDAEFVFGQLKAHFPEAVITARQDTLEQAWEQSTGSVLVHEFGLADEFMIPLRSRSEMATDPLVSLCGALEHLQPGELGVLQVLFQPAWSPWVRHMRAAVTTEDGRPFFDNAPELVTQTKRKTAGPLYAVVVRVATCGTDEARADTLLRQLAGALRLFGHHDANALLLLDNEDYPAVAHAQDLLRRTTHRSGMLLNSEELIALVHLPSSAVRSRKLQRETKHTKAAPEALLGAGLVLGENTHEGRTVRPALDVEQRVRHLHLIGASGTGKSTLLLNLIGQDIYQGNGFAVIDPHGDLIDQIIACLPPERIADVILIDPADSEFPVGLNLLSAHSDEEKNLLASDLVAVFRRLSTSWGDQMNSVLGNAILAFLESERGGTLADLRRFLIEPEFRKEFLATVRDPEVAYYWRQEFPLLKGGSLGPLLTRLDTFLRPKAIRYMVAQRENRIDFGAVMNEGRIVLVKLSQGLIGEENASLLGSLLVAKFHQLAIARQALSREQRRPFFLYLDEFQHFVSPSMQAILSGARKYGLGLVLAHQDLRQLARDPELMGAVMANAGTRICFRVSDGDAEKLAGGFAEFRAEDLQRLETGEAICRVGRADHDFNLTTRLPPEVSAEDAENRRTYLREVSRRAYGRPRSEVEAELARARTPFSEERVDPFARRTARPEPMPEPDNAPPVEAIQHPPVSTVQATPPSASPSPPPLPKPDAPRSETLVPKLGTTEDREHRRLQNSIAMIGQQRGWRSQLEAPLGEHGNADVLLTKNEFRVACEVALTSPPEYEVQSIGKRLAAGVTHVLVVSTDPGHLDQIATLASKTYGRAVGERVRFGPPDLVAGVLDELDASLVAGEEVIGEMHVRYAARAVPREDQARRQEHLNTALKRLKGTKSRPRS